ncbi:MAG: hypothetical protein V4689_06940 [Verrucomicrobiota bacterium]
MTALQTFSARNFDGFRRVLFLCAHLLILLAATGNAGAENSDGTYRVKFASGQLDIATGPIQLSRGDVRRIMGFATGEVLVHRDNRLKLYPIDGHRLVKRFGLAAQTDLEVSTYGAGRIKLKKSGLALTGASTRPARFDFYLTQGGSGKLDISYEAKLVGKELSVRAFLKGKVLGERVTGQMKIVCEREADP